MYRAKYNNAEPRDEDEEGIEMNFQCEHLHSWNVRTSECIPGDALCSRAEESVLLDLHCPAAAAPAAKA